MHDEDLLRCARERLLFVNRRSDIIMHRGEGLWLEDRAGRRYLDFVGGWAVNCLGHSPRPLVEALSRQAELLINASPQFYNEPLLEYADLLVGNSPLDRVFFMSTGAEANESAIKLARKYGLTRRGGATEIITTQKSFHGRTLMTMAATGKPHWETLYGAALPGFRKAAFNDLDAAAALVSDRTCAIMLEPVQGEGGVNVADAGYLSGLRELCDRHGLLLIFDEVQTGMGRCGRLFASEHYGVKPDIMTLGKGIGGGFPLSAMLATEALNIFEPGDQGGTYTGQPLAMVAGLAVLRELLGPGFLERVRHMSSVLFARLEDLARTHELSNLRGLGLLLAFDLSHSRGADVVQACLDDGLLINATQESTIRLMPPLILEEEHVDRLVEVLGRQLARK